MIEYENLGKLNEPYFSEFKNKFDSVLNSGWFILGQQVNQFESSFAKFLGVSHFVGVASGLDALLLSMKALEIPEGSEVIVPSNTYIATILAIRQAGLVPVLVEPDIQTYNIDPAKIEAKVTSKTKALIVVHLFGKPCEMDLIQSICKRHQLQLVEDCAQAHGAKFNGQIVGSFGLGAFSFYPTKNLGALGDAGGISCHDPGIAEKLKCLRNYGSKVKYYNQDIGYNSRLDEVQAAFLNVKLAKLEKINLYKRELADIYHAELSDRFIKPVRKSQHHDVFHIYNIRFEKRDSLRQFLLENGIKTEIHYPVAPFNQTAFKGVWNAQEYPISSEIHKTTLSLPISNIHSKEDILRICKTLNEF